MLFSYGFIEEGMRSAKTLFLEIDIPEDDPLRQAKKAKSNSAPGVRLFEKEEEGTSWESQFVWLMCVNEEDGLDFRMAQREGGERELTMRWKGVKMEDASGLGGLLEKEEGMWPVFRLRAVSTVQERVEAQLRELRRSRSTRQAAMEETAVGDRPYRLAMRLCSLEQDLLERAYGDLEDEVRLFVPCSSGSEQS